MSTETSVTDRYKINVDREERGRTRCEEGGRRRGAPGFALGIVVTGAMELCEAVGTGAAGYQGIKKIRTDTPVPVPVPDPGTLQTSQDTGTVHTLMQIAIQRVMELRLR